jgi:monofunctional biosynthetic peptidoglycan transglycosylase
LSPSPRPGRGSSNGSRSRPAAKFVSRAAAAAAAVLFASVAYAYLTLPDVRLLAKSNPSTTAFMDLRAEEARARGDQPRRVQRWASSSHVSSDLKHAILIAEDDAFFQHEGVDFTQLRESIEVDWARGSFTRGASTITQQLAKNLYLSPSRNPLRKMREFIIARRLEAELTKERILELYLNVIELGDGIYGVEAAAQTYFHRPAATLGPAESALLAGAIINARLLNPAHPTKRLLRRQQLILKRMRVGPPAGTRTPAEKKLEAPKLEEEDRGPDEEDKIEKPDERKLEPPESEQR